MFTENQLLSCDLKSCVSNQRVEGNTIYLFILQIKNTTKRLKFQCGLTVDSSFSFVSLLLLITVYDLSIHEDLGKKQPLIYNVYHMSKH